MRYSLLLASLVVPALLSAQQPTGGQGGQTQQAGQAGKSGKAGQEAARRARAKGARVAARHVMLTADSIQWKAGPPSLPSGAEAAVIDGDPSKRGLFAMRLRLPDGYRIPPHFHAAAEHVTVISGTFVLGHGGEWKEDAMTPLPAGSFTVMPPGMRHYVEARGETVVQVHAMGPWKLIYVNKDDDPRNKPKEATGTQE